MLDTKGTSQLDQIILEHNFWSYLYRLGLPYVGKLEQRASENGLSVGQYARLVLVMHFEETANHRVADEIARLRGEVTDLRAEHALGRKSARSPY